MKKRGHSGFLLYNCDMLRAVRRKRFQKEPELTGVKFALDSHNRNGICLLLLNRIVRVPDWFLFLPVEKRYLIQI